jgi:hypothetical protein
MARRESSADDSRASAKRARRRCRRKKTTSSSLNQIPYAALSTGYDSNPDQEVEGEGSGFNLGKLGLRLQNEQGSTEVDFRVEGLYRELWKNEGPDRENIAPASPTTTDYAYAAVRHETNAIELRLENFAEQKGNGDGAEEDDF